MSVMTAEDVLTVLRADAAERDAKYKAEQAKRDAEQEKRDAEFKAMLEEMQRRHRIADEKFDRMQQAADEKFERMQQLTGSMQLDLGELIELVLMPKLCKEINKCGHTFTASSPNKKFYRDDGKHLMLEMDLLLENCDEVMVIEIKSDCKPKDIDWHLGRLKKLRQHENITGMKGRTMYAAIATVTIEDDVRDMALNHGMYVITIREEEDRVDVIQPETKGQW